MSLSSYIQKVSAAITEQNSQGFWESLSFSRLSPQEKKSLAIGAATLSSLKTTCNHYLEQPFNQIVLFHLRSLFFAQKLEFAEAYKLENQALDLLYKLIETDRETNWWVSAINAVASHFRLCSYKVDDAQKTDKTQKAAEHELKKFFGRMIIDRSHAGATKKVGCLFIIIHMFKIYFRLGSLRLCNHILMTVKNPNFPKLEEFPKAQKVAFNFYMGRLQLFEEKYSEAEEGLTAALKECPRWSPRNKRRILTFLIPIKLLKGKFPRKALLQKYGLRQFEELIEATQKGNTALFNKALEKNQEFFIRKGIYLILEKLKMILFRNLFRKVHIYNQKQGDKKAMLPLHMLRAALVVVGGEMEDDEIECILANLIFAGYIKGYIAHKRYLVLSKIEPFPAISTVVG